MKITVSKHTTIDWDAVKNELAGEASKAIEGLIETAKFEAEKLESGQAKTFSSYIGKITIRRAKD